ncbi:GDP-mannose 4,6-dehydratase [Candidatus Sumerlaeota bacterium]|nr:GDP-mannose 4,6-dehydratase [Candidatus Sumerlaeota bacterium]HMZ51194.1 GDP-mannose 4,6-dehydratase [Candidatus Sumerlaeota bacterium]HNM46270.1 GDP-mannose 4,6-dehydratase [Candidatus Sumerlaeota bacterium]
MAKKALITGITGQDGSYLAELLLKKGYEVHGLVRRASTFNRSRIDHLHVDEHSSSAKLFLHYGDLSDSNSLMNVLYDVQPEEIYNLAAQSHVRVSFDNAEYTADVTGTGALRLLEASRRLVPKARVYQASSSEMFGGVQNRAQDENTPFHPRSPYACAKVFAFWQTVNYREAYNMHASNGILFNHESPRRGETFVTRKVTMGAARIKMGLQEKLYMGNLESQRDWGFAGDYVEAMWLMLQQDKADDYVIATGETHTVRKLIEVAFGYLDLDWKKYVEIDQRYYRPSEVDFLLGDPAKAKRVLGWQPKVTFEGLIKMMADSDLQAAKRELASRG